MHCGPNPYSWPHLPPASLLLHSLYSVLPRVFFFLNDPATTEIYTLSLHDALPISAAVAVAAGARLGPTGVGAFDVVGTFLFIVLVMKSIDGLGKDRKSTRLNSSHITISYAVFCLKKKK